MRISFRSSLTFWVIVAFCLICALQIFPWTGIFLMFFGAPIWTGYILHLIAVAMVIDVVYKKLSKAVLFIPLVCYGAYYSMFLSETFFIKDIESNLQRENPSEIIAYNPEEHSLIANPHMIKEYKLPVVYSVNRNSPEGYLSNRLATKELCKAAKGVHDSAHTFGVSWYRFGENFYSKAFPNVCDFRMPDRPDKKLLRVSPKESDEDGGHLKKTTYSFFLEQEFLGEYVGASYEKMPLFPKFFIGCGLISSTPAWKCYFQLIRKRIVLETFPALSVGAEAGDSHIARLLSIQKYTAKDLLSFTDYPETREKFFKLMRGKDELDEWGLRKDNPYRPKIAEKEGVPSFEGSIYSGNKGGYFYDFIRENEGKVVYLDIEAQPNARRDSFTNYGVCKKVVSDCTSRTDTTYQIKNANGKPHYFEEEGKFKGFFKVGTAKLFENKYNKGDNDTITILTVVPE